MEPGLPVILKLRGRRCVVVGGGAVALRRVKSLLEVGAVVTVVAPEMDESIQQQGVCCQSRAYERGDLKGAVLVVVATDDASVNEQVARDAEAGGVWVNRADDPDAGDLRIPAHAHHGPITLAVDTQGISPAAAATIRKQLSDALDDDWPRLLEIAETLRKEVQHRFTDPPTRRQRLRQLTDPQAMTILKQQGESALRDHLHQQIDLP